MYDESGDDNRDELTNERGGETCNNSVTIRQCYLLLFLLKLRAADATMFSQCPGVPCQYRHFFASREY